MEVVPWLVPALVAGALASPRLGLGYFFDDYYFINLRGTGNPALYLNPRYLELDPSLLYYRPITQGLYGLLLRAIDPQTGYIGHGINLLLLMTCVALLARWVRRLAGPGTGFLAGTIFASLGAAPSLVAWVSGSHDLFAIMFLLLALTFRHDGHEGPAIGCAALALLSKETAVAVFPLLIFYNRVLGRPGSLFRSVMAYGAVLIAWGAIHPQVHRLFAHGFQAGSTGYVGVAHPERWGVYLARYLLTLDNIPLTGIKTPWPGDLTLAAVSGLALIAAGLAVARRLRPYRAGKEGVPDHASVSRLVLLGLLLTLPSLLLPSLLVNHWMPYLAVMAAPGAAILFALVVRRGPAVVPAAALATFLLLGVWYRGMVLPNESAWSEPFLVDAARSVPLLRKNLLALYPTVPRGAQLLVSIAGTGSRGMAPVIAATLYEGQAPSLWYGDQSLHTARPEARAAGYPTDILLRVTSGLDVIDIVPVECRYRSTAGAAVSVFDIGRPISTYARGVAASGNPDLAIRILGRLAELDQDEYRSYDLRIAASVALAYGRREEAGRLRATASPLERQAALDLMGRVFGDATSNAMLDSCAYWAFEISPQDVDATRYYLSVFRELGNPRQIEHFARMLDRLRPGDPEARGALQWLAKEAP